MSGRRLVLLCSVLLLGGVSLVAACAQLGWGRGGGRWWKGNTHTHTLWSDGNGAPELVADWYKREGYEFLVLSDHNVLSQGERWFPVEPDGRLRPEHVQALRQRFGTERVELREVDGRREMRLVTLAELRERFEQPGRFLFVEGEEVTDAYDGKPVHVNGIHLAEFIEPQGGTSVVDVMNRNVSAIAAQGERLGRPTLAHINHPNFGWAFSWQELASVLDDRFFEVYNGHPGVRNAGDGEHLGLEAVWDRALTLRLTELDLGLLYGLATDDAHHYHGMAIGRSNAGRGWLMVRCAELEGDALVQALQRGDFYGSSGVTLEDVRADDEEYVVDIESEPGLTYTTRFRGTRLFAGAVVVPGEVLLETTDDPAVYTFTGEELYVRATVTSSRLHSNPHAEGDHEQAWCQPVQVRGRGD